MGEQSIFKWLRNQQPVPLSHYVGCRLGVCRHQSLLLFAALKELGHNTVYATYKAGTNSHVIVLDSIDGNTLVIDPTYLLLKNGINDFFKGRSGVVLDIYPNPK